VSTQPSKERRGRALIVTSQQRERQLSRRDRKSGPAHAEKFE